MLDHIAAILGVKKAGLIAGFFGAMISLKFLNEVKTWPPRIVMALCGTLCAAFVTPGIADYFHWSDRVESALAFAFGMFGMTFSGAVIQALRELKIAEALASWFKRPGA